jgi:hypothetical protein
MSGARTAHDCGGDIPRSAVVEVVTLCVRGSTFSFLLALAEVTKKKHGARFGNTPGLPDDDEACVTRLTWFPGLPFAINKPMNKLCVGRHPWPMSGRELGANPF